MNLRTRVLLMGFFAIGLQLLLLGVWYFYAVEPKINNLEENLVEKSLHRGVEIIQRELFHLEHLSQLLAQQSVIQDLVDPASHTVTVPRSLEKKMEWGELNVIYVINNQHKVIWENIFDLNADQPYPAQPILTSLADMRPTFLIHSSLMSLQSGIHNTALGPLMIVSAPIVDNQTSKIHGTLLVGKLLTPELMQLLQSISSTDIQLWPSEAATLNKQQLSINHRLMGSESDFLIDRTDDLLRGYISIPDLNEQRNLIVSVTLARDFSKTVKWGVLELTLSFVMIIFLLVLLITFTFQKQILAPMQRLIAHFTHFQDQWRPIPVSSLSIEMRNLSKTISQFMTRQQHQKTHEILLASKKSAHLAQTRIHTQIQEVIQPLIIGLQETEKKLYNLPINDIEGIITRGRIGSPSAQDLTDYWDKLQLVSDRLRHYQKQTRHYLYALYSKGLRNAAALRVKTYTFESKRKKRLPIYGEKSSND